VLPPEVDRIVGRYLSLVDRLLPGRVGGAYVVGSTALGAYRPGRSDVDVVLVVDGRLRPDELRRYRVVHAAAAVGSAARALPRGRLAVPGTCNAVVVDAGDLHRPVTAIVPVAAHAGERFTVGRAFDVNPAVWTILARRGIAVRGPEPVTLGLDPEPDRLRSWTLGNLDDYWAPWARGLLARPAWRGRRGWRWQAAWGVLGPARMHHTIATGDVVAKEAAGEYARATFGERWHPIVDEALAYRHDRPVRDPELDGAVRARQAAEFALAVVDDAHTL
jgi:hypothetical protein